MNENARKWVEALRSGEFEQAQARLRDDDSYCCLGVACELYRRETGKGRWTKAGAFHLGSVAETDWLPTAVQRWLGLAHPAGKYDWNSLVFLNDARDSFKAIANVIESEPEDLFV